MNEELEAFQVRIQHIRDFLYGKSRRYDYLLGKVDLIEEMTLQDCDDNIIIAPHFVMKAEELLIPILEEVGQW